MAGSKLVLLLVCASLLCSLQSCHGRQGPAETLRHAANPFAEDQCVVQTWQTCATECPTNSTLPAVMLGKNGAHVGKLLGVPIQEYPVMSIESCCKSCTAFNDLHWNNIFGYVCDYWGWQQVNGFSGRCQLFDLKSLCGRGAARALKERSMFNSSRTDTVSFPVAC
eukprot:TRINITY_DN32347_c0_g1_i1.p1 TRINITY_DN32347_c0_g1~~TRINITY_DN32347_c0_g1_i1.p1  ORF type:complete len:166 (+),score=12.07 TRINITY_DN32347_c0_g1_i1:592-1089(+)